MIESMAHAMNLARHFAVTYGGRDAMGRHGGNHDFAKGATEGAHIRAVLETALRGRDLSASDVRLGWLRDWAIAQGILEGGQ